MAFHATLDQMVKMQDTLEQMLTESDDALREAVLGSEEVLKAAQAARLTPERYANGVFASLASACVRIQQRLNLGALPDSTGVSGTGFTGGPMEQKTRARGNTSSCSFCGRAQEQVERLVAGPNQVFICNECVSLSQELLQQ